MKEVLVFGRGELYHKKEKEIIKTYRIVGYLDNAVQDDGEFMGNIPVHSPEKLNELPLYDILIVSIHFIAMWKQLKSLGVTDDRILFGLFLSPLSTDLERDLYAEDVKMLSREGRICYSSELLGVEGDFSDDSEFKTLFRKITTKKHKEIDAVRGLSVLPLNRNQGLERGTAVDRFYIEQFLRENKEDIHGVCLEVGDDRYTKKFGENRVEKSIVTHVKGWGDRSIKANFETFEGLEENMVDCMICTQVMQYIFDVRRAFSNIYRVLKPGGVALLTVPGIKSLSIYDDENWGERWSFTKKSVMELCNQAVTSGRFTINTYGNVKIATAYLYGLCVEDIEEEDFEYSDSQYPFLLSIRIIKNSKPVKGKEKNREK